MAHAPYSHYSPELGQEICNRLAEGETLHTICRDPEMPTRKNVWVWLQNDQLKVDDETTFAEAYMEARDFQAERWADDVIDAAKVELQGDRHDGPRVQAARLEVDAKRWMIQRRLASVYGEKVTHQGSKDAPITVVIRRVGEEDKPSGGQ